jgi:hypothetical protein
LDWPAFLRHSKTGQTNRLEMKPRRQRSQHPFPKSPRLHSRYVRSDFRNGRSLRPSSSNLIRSVEQDSDGFLKLESLNFFETPSPNEIVREKSGPKPSGKKQRKATTHLSLFVASAPEMSPLLVAFCHLNLSPFVAFCRNARPGFISL